MIQIKIKLTDLYNAGACQEGRDAAAIFWEEQGLDPDEPYQTKLTSKKFMKLCTHPIIGENIAWLILKGLLPAPNFTRVELNCKKFGPLPPHRSPFFQFYQSTIRKMHFGCRSWADAWVSVGGEFVKCKWAGGIEDSSFYGSGFNQCEWSTLTVTRTYFTDCSFDGCFFDNTTFIHSTFVDMHFPAEFEAAAFTDCNFHKCKWLGDTPPEGWQVNPCTKHMSRVTSTEE